MLKLPAAAAKSVFADNLTISAPSWAPGFVCPAGFAWYNESDAYGDSGFEWVGDVLEIYSHTGNAQSCCQAAGGDGIGVFKPGAPNIGRYYTLCNPELNCTGGSAYTCTVFENVTATKPLPGAISGLAQAPVQLLPQPPPPLKTEGSEYGNPFLGACTTSSAGDEINATLIGVPGAAVCAPACGPTTPCPLPDDDGATAQCILALLNSTEGTFQPTQCALVCDPAIANDGCPAGATCRSLYNATHQQAGAPDTGVCMYESRGGSGRGGSGLVDWAGPHRWDTPHQSGE